ncbi:Hypothetical protein CINCED_3A021415 [Cinara cedri]|uniref:Uncharacterized protein n=1 Tax=Cinara cedri TaxID=506608 RepID=A0A5E4MRS4_9HEMI|nr:Hypothetical protein CINCED_3A021415 [Cinara cedri]
MDDTKRGKFFFFESHKNKTPQIRVNKTNGQTSHNELATVVDEKFPFDSPAHSCESSSSYILQYYDQHDVHRGFVNREHAFHGDLDVTGTVLAKRSKYEHRRRSVERNRSIKKRLSSDNKERVHHGQKRGSGCRRTRISGFFR